jgi:mortality factor 4-like protein 1
METYIIYYSRAFLWYWACLSQLVTLPRKPTVAQLLHSFKKEILAKDRKEEQQLEEVVAGLKLYFNRALGAMLLYRFERQQYTDLRKKFPKKEMSDIYGAEHLLRIFGKYH